VSSLEAPILTSTGRDDNRRVGQDAGVSGSRARLSVVLIITFLGSIGSGTFWAGLFFVSAGRYHFTAQANLVLATVMGAVYGVAARASGRLARGRAPRQVLSAALLVWTVAALTPVLLPDARAALWVAALIGSAASATTFPVVESYLTAGRHGPEMRSAIGQFNLTWTPATALALIVLPLLSTRPLAVFAISGAATAAAWACIWFLPPHPAAHESEAASGAVGASYPALLRAASWLLPFSYVVAAALAPVLPHRLDTLGAGAAASPLAALWMAARFVVLLIMWRSSFWHGRWGTLAAGGVALTGGLALVLLAPALPAVLGGLLLFGAGMGLVYYAALYYSMAVGHAAVDAGGGFEALIGVGYCLGPLLGLIAQALAHR
jgi:hypothetical protein